MNYQNDCPFCDVPCTIIECSYNKKHIGVCMVCDISFVKKESNSNTCSENCKKSLKENNE